MVLQIRKRMLSVGRSSESGLDKDGSKRVRVGSYWEISLEDRLLNQEVLGVPP